MIIQNNLNFDNDFPITIEKKFNELSFLYNKRIPSHNLEKNIPNLPDENENSCGKINNQLNLLKKLKDIKNLKTFKIFKNFSKNNDNNNYNSRKIYKNSNYYNNSYSIENNDSIFINKSDIKTIYLNNKIINKDINDNKGDNNSKINNLNKIDDLGNSIKVKKNKKLIFMNKSLIKPKNTNNDVVAKKRRRSIYRGVSKNGNNWQVIVYSKNSKGYIGVFKTQEIAARIYDIISIKNNGIKAKTNFEYDVHQIQNITEAYIDYKSKDIEEIISYLIKK